MSDFDPYRTWLGIQTTDRAPNFYELLAIGRDEHDAQVIQNAFEQRSKLVKSKRGTGHDADVNSMLIQLHDAKMTLLQPQMRAKYDRRLHRSQTRRTNLGTVPQTSAPRGRGTVGEESGIVKMFVGIFAVLAIGCGVMYWFANRTDRADAPQAANNGINNQDDAHEVADRQPEKLDNDPAPVDKQEDEQWQELFNGIDLDGWRYRNPQRASGWLVSNSVLRLADPSNKSSDLVSIAEFGDFELTFDFWLDRGANSGLFLRGRYEIALEDIPSVGANGTRPSAACGAIWGQAAPNAENYQFYGPQTWNSMRVRLVGQEVSVWLNDSLVVDRHQLTGPTPRPLFRDLAGSGPLVLQRHTGEVRFRALRIRELDD